MNILSKPLVNYSIFFSFLILFFQNRDLQFIKMWFSIYPESCNSSLHVVITAYNSFKYKFNFIKFKFIWNCVFQLNTRLIFPIYISSLRIFFKVSSRELSLMSRLVYIYMYVLITF